jgi:glycosyltransferase involved in cell wall biosynthesis
MKIGIFASEFPYKKPFNDLVPQSGYLSGGVGEVTYQLALQFNKRNNEVYIFTSSADKEDDIENFENITLLRYGINCKIANSGISFKYLRGIRNFELDVVHLQAGSPPATVASMNYLKKVNTPLVTTHHLDPEWDSGDLLRRILMYGYAKFYLPRVFSRSDVLIALSKFFLRSEYLSPFTEKIRIIPNGINVDDYNIPKTNEECRDILGIPKDIPVILFVGSIVERKGLDTLLHAMPIIIKRVPEILLIIVGSSTNFSDQLKKLSHRLGIERNILFVGYVDESHKLFYYKASDVFVLPSFLEAYPLVLLEASACGLPSIVSNLEVFNAFIDENVNGLFFKVGDEAQLAKVVIQLINDKKLRTDLGHHAKDRILNFSWENIGGQIEEIYREIS